MRDTVMPSRISLRKTPLFRPVSTHRSLFVVHMRPDNTNDAHTLDGTWVHVALMMQDDGHKSMLTVGLCSCEQSI